MCSTEVQDHLFTSLELPEFNCISKLSAHNTIINPVNREELLKGWIMGLVS